MVADNDNEETSAGPHEPTLIAFAVNIEFVKRLVLAQNADDFKPKALSVVRTWVALQIDSAQGYLDAAAEQEGATPELMLLARQIAEALAWLEALQ